MLPEARSFEVLLAVPTSSVAVVIGTELARSSLLTTAPVELTLTKAAVMVPVAVTPAKVASV